MKIICKKSLLSENINIVSKAVSSRTTLPILECILLIVDEKGFRLIGNDLELGIETKEIDAEVIRQGSIALDSKMFSDIIRRLPGDNAEIEVDEKNVTIIKSNKSEFKILGNTGDEFPFLPEVEKASEYLLSSAELKNMIRQTIFSVAVDDSKAVMTGELIEIKDSMIKLVSVDGFRISLRVFDMDSENPDIKAVIPGKTLNEISKILPQDENSMVSLYFTDKHVLFELEGCTVVSRLLEGEFINYENVFTEDYTTLINVEREIMLESLERASLISKDAKKNPVKLKIEDNMVIITSNTEIGTSYEEIPVELDGLNIEIAFNPRYLTDALKVMDDDRITLQFTTPLSPCIIKGDSEALFKYLVLPLRLKN